MEGKEMTREEKIETLQIFAGWTEEQKNLFALGVVIGAYKTRFGKETDDEQRSA